MSSWDRMPPASQVPAPPPEPDRPRFDEGGLSDLRRFIRRRAPLVVLIVIAFAILALFLVISITSTPLPGG
jgi:hypothetical protein